MSDYRLYYLDSAGRIARREDLECEDDTQAIREAAARGAGLQVELWQRGRMIQKLPGDGLEPGMAPADGELAARPSPQDKLGAHGRLPISRGMNFRPTALERAFTLARSGDCDGVSAIREQLRSEGYSLNQLEGPSLTRQLRALCVESRKADSD